ncbi:hypothetical protein CXB51_018998 [Gossypium anomalum]|uniref:DUF7745 domain-containing protein n=1 Tax=Gossypium anomalum TaxID=47600 RepID=A0A8J5YYV2_9ROSI|nr:hypothetical protein CXB51_018998 [Gossypium anomalum]
MENEFLDKMEDNAAVRIWSKKTRLEKLFYCNYGDLSYLLDIKMDKHLFRALAQFWNPGYNCFTFGKVDLVPIVEEYTTLLRSLKIPPDKVYSRTANVSTFLKKLMNITGMSEQWVITRIKQKGDGKCISWNCLRDLILTHPDINKMINVFALSIYGLVVFLKILGHVDEAVSNLFDRLDKRVTLVLAISELIRAANVPTFLKKLMIITGISEQWVAARIKANKVYHVDEAVEEYTTLLHSPKIQPDKVYSRAANVPTFLKKLMIITGISEQWVAARIKQNGDGKCIPWNSLRDLILIHPDMKKRVDVFALSIYGLVVFPKALGHVDEAVLDLFDKLDKRVTLILAISEPIRAANVPTFLKKLMNITGMSEQWVAAQIKQKGDGHMDEAVSDLFDRLDKRVTPVPAILA